MQICKMAGISKMIVSRYAFLQNLTINYMIEPLEIALKKDFSLFDGLNQFLQMR